MADTDQVLNLAAIIRKVDGNHSKGAAALAESILDHPDFRAVLGEADEPAVPEGREPAAVISEPSDAELLCIAAEAIYGYGNGINPGDYEPATECAVEAYGSELCAYARAVLARWGNRQGSLTSSPPADGEVAELAAEIRHFLAGYQQMRGLDPEHIYSIHRGDKMEAHITVSRLTRAAELLQRQVPVPVSVSERLPGPGVKVLAHYFNGLGKGRTICAIWVPAKTRSDSYGDDDFTEYDEESDTFYWPEGWYETIENWDDLGYVKVDEGEVIYWQPIPKWPAHALPLPEVGE